MAKNVRKICRLWLLGEEVYALPIWLRDFSAPEVKQIFFPFLLIQTIFQKKFFWFKWQFFFSKKQLFNSFFFKNIVFKAFSKKRFFKQKSFTVIRMLISSRLISRMDTCQEKSWQWAGLEGLMKVTAEPIFFIVDFWVLAQTLDVFQLLSLPQSSSVTSTLLRMG